MESSVGDADDEKCASRLVNTDLAASLTRLAKLVEAEWGNSKSDVSCNKFIWSIWLRLHKANFGVIFLSNIQRLSIKSCMCIYVQALVRCQQPI